MSNSGLQEEILVHKLAICMCDVGPDCTRFSMIMRLSAFDCSLSNVVMHGSTIITINVLTGLRDNPVNPVQVSR